MKFDFNGRLLSGLSPAKGREHVDPCLDIPPETLMAKGIKDLWEEEFSQSQSQTRLSLIFFLTRHAFKYRQKKVLELCERGDWREDVLDQVNFKKVKKKALLALQYWFNGQWPLVLGFEPFKSEDILRYQAEGKRVLTLSLGDWESPIGHKADPLEFFLHDLEHAYQFFFDTGLYQKQKQFFSFMWEVWQRGELAPFCEDLGKREKIFYALSDMNTHPAHSWAYLKAVLPPSFFQVLLAQKDNIAQVKKSFDYPPPQAQD